MKNSPHRIAHLRKKALRDITQIFPKAAKNGKPQTIPVSLTLEGFKRLYPNLQPFVPKTAKVALHMFVHHLANRTPANTHHSKRTTPGEVTTNGPHFAPYTTPKSVHINVKPTLEKSRMLAKQILKQDYQQRRAA